MKIIHPLCALVSVALLAMAHDSAASAGACLVTPEELQTATDRVFSAGQESKAVDGSPLCVYAEVAAPTRKLIINVIEGRGKAAYESRVRLLTSNKKDAGALTGVGDAAFYNGTSAAVLKGDKLIAFSGVRRAAAKDLAPERIVTLLQAALGRASK